MNPAGGHEEDMQRAERIAYLIAGHLKGTLTEEESNELDDWITESNENLELFEKLTDEDNMEAAIAQYSAIDKGKGAAYQKLKKQIRTGGRRQVPIWFFLAAACVLVIAAISWLLLFHNETLNEKPFSHVQGQGELPAASERAVLTLSDGQTIILDSNKKGVLTNDGSIAIYQNAGGQLQYTGTETAMRYNTVNTPRGGQYQVVLGDGTRVWLNADSYLKFPAGFNGKQRKVELRGEAYFEVAKDGEHPFVVTIVSEVGDGATVEVLGTHFNINAYGDEGFVKTTLVEGIVRVSIDGSSQIIHPGEQAAINSSITVAKTDTAEAVAWKKGKFLFRNATVHTIGEQLRRWYDVDVAYEGNIGQHFNTEADRGLSLQQLIKALEGTNEVQFDLQGRKLVIKPAKVLR
jgi:ferric-dicitrate binding protein FerR (iron transport regulator)